MGIIAWGILLLISAVLATAAQYTIFRNDRDPNDYDWVYIAGGALLGGFTAHVWYPGFGPVVDGLNLVPALLGSVAGAIVVELVYRLVLRPRKLA
jgi:cytochrome c biogenesis protein CcdA